ncbi:MAG: VCBS repeat-containing protein, partial [Candidatus Hydrogenedentes bacterium]|nr:VCBS repeat-containing protein [Candidatus Hydrogenedentota bacterium]
VRKLPFTTFGNRPNVLFMNVNGIMTDLTSTYVPEFISSVDFPDGDNARDVQPGNFNGDGWPDLIIANAGNDGSNGQQPRMFINLGEDIAGDWLGYEDQSWRIPFLSSTAGSQPNACAVGVGDLTGNGVDDFYLVDYNNDLDDRLLINDGTGVFSSSFDVATGNAPRTVLASDLDKDGNQDLVVSSPVTSSIAIHRVDGNGGFEAPVFLSVDTNPTRMVLGEFTGDGNVDLLIVLFETDADTVSSGKLLCLAGDGQGGFEHHADFSVSPGVIALLTDDLDRDGDTDLVLANSSENFVATVLGTGTSLAIERRFPAGTSPRMAVAGDINKDGDIDLLVANLNSREVTFLPGDGSGAFETAISIPAGGRARALALGHLNSDSNLDFVVTNLDESRVAIFTGRGDGSFDTVTYYDVRGSDSTRSAEPRSVVIADVNNDNNADLVVGNANRDTVAILIGAGDGTFGVATEYGVGNFPLSVQVADFDNNGALDIAVANGVDVDGSGTQASAIHVLPGNGDGTFDSDNMIGYVANTGPGSLIAWDMDQDGDIDLATSHNGLDSVQIFNGRGDGRFSSGGVLSMGDAPNTVGVADINGDGLPDLFTTGDTGILSYRLYNEAGGFESRKELRVGEFPIEALLADLNGDGRIDIATPNLDSDDISIVLGAAE